MIGTGVLIVGLVIFVVGLLLRLAAPMVIGTPPVHDGIGGQDTKNMLNGCLGLILGLVGICLGGFIAVIGGILMFFHI